MSENTSSQAPGGTASPRPASAPGQGFFDWVRRIGISRGDSWIGGVCGGIAARLGIDPIVVRGIAVVVALLGGPAFLLYALAWLLLPDAAGRIHLESLVRGVFDAATAGVIVFALLAFLPIAQGVWWAASWPFGTSVGWPETLGKVFWSAVVVAAIVLLIVWASRRSGGWGASPWTGSPGDVGGTSTAGPSASSFAEGTTPPSSEPTGAAWPAGAASPTAPAAPVQGASPEALADWRAQQAEWRTRYTEWKRQQSAATREYREQRSAEAARRQADALERARVFRLAHPRTGGPFVAITLGTAVIVGALAAAVAWGAPRLDGYQTVFGFAAATAVLGLSMMVAGLMRRSSGFLTFVTIALTVLTVLLLIGAATHSTLVGGLPSFSYSY
jgi:phage shock protein PspC (stress-responsive transcriptional regulator)